MRILFVAGREPSYVRNAMILHSLMKNGVTVIDCSDSSKNYPLRFFNVVWKFLGHRKDTFDCVLVGFFGQPLLPIIRKFVRKKILFDAFLSVYDTMCLDRKRFKPSSLPGKFFFALDKQACEQADLILLDTDAHIDYFTETFGLPRRKFRRVFVGADESFFYPREARRNDGKVRVFYYSTFLPLHGTEVVIRAAARLREEKDLEFIVVGTGMEYKKIRKLAQALNIENIHFIDWIPYAELPLEIAKSDICLGGHFSNIDKAKRVIAGKTFQFIAMKKPVIVGECAGNRELFTDRESALFVTMGDPEALARAILELRNDPILRERIAEGGYKAFEGRCTTGVIAREIATILSSVTSK